jgi:hypothetical protein
MAENEKTSARVASIASKILTMDKPYNLSDQLWEDIKTLAGSALTQASDKPIINRLASLGEIGKKESLSPGLWKAMQQYKAG